MKDKLKGLVLGVLIGSLVTGSTAMAASGTNIKVVMKNVGIYFNGTKKTSAQSILYNGSVYVPVSSIGKAINTSVGYVNGDLYIGKQPQRFVTEAEAEKLVYNKIKKEAAKYDLHFMYESTSNNKHVVRVYEDFEDHIATYGWYYVNIFTGKVTKMDTTTGEEVEVK